MLLTKWKWSSMTDENIRFVSSVLLSEDSRAPISVVSGKLTSGSLRNLKCVLEYTYFPNQKLAQEIESNLAGIVPCEMRTDYTMFCHNGRRW